MSIIRRRLVVGVRAQKFFCFTFRCFPLKTKYETEKEKQITINLKLWSPNLATFIIIIIIIIIIDIFQDDHWTFWEGGGEGYKWV